jgi:hypothetical protein
MLPAVADMAERELEVGIAESAGLGRLFERDHPCTIAGEDGG